MKRKVNILVLMLLAFLSVGFAALTTTLLFNGEVTLLANTSDFDVVFTDSSTNDNGFSYISSDGSTLTYITPKLTEVGDEAVLHYTVSNNSREFDANVEINMADQEGNAFDSEYVSIENTVPVNSTIAANESSDGVLTIKLLKPSNKNMSLDFELTIDADSVERDTIVEPIINDFTFEGLEPGLYDENNLMLASWDDLINNYGLDVEADTVMDINYSIIPDNVKSLAEKAINDNAATDYYSIITNFALTFGYVDSEHAMTNVIKNNPELASGTTLVIGDNVSKIGAYAFALSRNLVNIYVPSSVTSIGDEAFTCCGNLVNLQLDAKITSIPQQMVFFDKKLDTLNIPEGVTEIGRDAFGFSKLNKLHLPSTFTGDVDHVFELPTYIGFIDVDSNNSKYTSVDGVLYNNSIYILYYYPSLKKDSTYVFPSTLREVKSNAIVYNSYIKHIVFNSEVYLNDASIGVDSELIDISFNQGIYRYQGIAIGYNEKLQNIYVPVNRNGYNDVDGVLFYMYDLLYYPSGRVLETYTTPESSKTIKEHAFNYNQYIKNLIISEGTTTIENNAIIYNNIETVSIPSTVKTIGEHNFDGCNKLINIDIEAGNEYFKFEDGVLYDKSQTKIYTYLATKNDEEFTVPNGITSIKAEGWVDLSVFQKNIYLKTLNLPDSISDIDNYYLSSLPNLTNVNINSDKYVSENGIVYDKEKATLVLYPRGKEANTFVVPSGVKYISKSAFEHSGLYDIVLPEGLVEIGNDAFEYSDTLNSINIPSSVTSIGYYAFYKCNNLNSVTFANPNGWKYKGQVLDSNDLSNPSKVASMLRDTQYNGYLNSWTRTE